ncbi:hypothetical protein C8Q77DRAFT_1141359 [Trametes polyzona]|nr:hypothetical protein C8Q77DRAFT_1141359 [Trametes polyzona]
MSGSGWDIWGAIAGVLGILVSLIPPFFFWVHTRLPSKKLPALLALLAQTQELFNNARDEGLMTENEIAAIGNALSIASVHACEFDATVHSSTSYPSNVRNWWRGVTGRILKLHGELNALRVRLLVRYSRERRTQILKYSMSLNTDTTDHSMLSTESILTAHSSYREPFAQSRSASISLPIDSMAYELSRLSATPSARKVTDADITDCARSHHPNGATQPVGGYYLLASDGANVLVSRADLQDLLSLTYAHPLLCAEADTPHQKVREEVLHRLARQLDGPGYTFSPKTGARGTYPGAFSRLVRLAFGVRHGGAIDGTIGRDPESLLPSGFLLESLDGPFVDK